MLPAVNKGVGMNMGFPDVCLTPAGPAAVPVPYPNMAMHAMAAPFAPNVLISMMPALNLGSMIPMTMGMEPGVLHPLYKQMGMFTMGDPVVMINGLPAVALSHPTTGNMMNNAAGAVMVPSVTNVLYSLAGGPAPGAETATLDAGALATLGALAGVPSSPGVQPPVGAARVLDGATGYIAVRRFTAAVPSLLHHAITGLWRAGMERLTLDLRDNPGGDLQAAIALAGDFLASGDVLAIVVDGDDDRVVHRAWHGGPLYTMPLRLLVNRGTASAAELFAGSLQVHGRAVIAGERTHGKASAQAVVPASEQARYATVARFLLPDGRDIAGTGIDPDEPEPRGSEER